MSPRLRRSSSNSGALSSSGGKTFVQLKSKPTGRHLPMMNVSRSVDCPPVTYTVTLSPRIWPGDDGRAETMRLLLRRAHPIACPS